jgi:hypothetical protein
MRIYEGSPRQDYEEVLRSIGAFLDQRGMRDILLAEAPDGFIVQGLVPSAAGGGGWSDTMGHLQKETLTFLDDDISRFMDEALARRNAGAQRDDAAAGQYEKGLRVIGQYIDKQKPRDVFFFEQEGAFVLRLLMGSQSGVHHVLAEFTRDDISQMIDHGPAWRQSDRSGEPQGQPTTGSPQSA